MAPTRRVFVSMPADRWLTPGQNALKWGIVEEIEALGVTTEIFYDPRGKPSLAAGSAWTAAGADAVARRCVGLVVIGMPRWLFRDDDGLVHLPTEYNHYEGAIAYTLGLPMLVLVQKDVLRRVVFDPSYHGYVGEMSPSAGPAWLKTSDFRVPFRYWKDELGKRRDVFLGYCSTSGATAKTLKHFMTKELGVTVLDWRSFKPGRTILQQIEEAASRCSAGVFLFTGDDELAHGPSGSKAAPRDNVVFEAGYFISAKGKERVLVVRQAGAKMPADLGGDIYASFKDPARLASVKTTIKQFVRAL